MTSVEAAEVTRRVMVAARRHRVAIVPAIRFDPGRPRRAVVERRPGVWTVLLPGPAELTEDTLTGHLLDALAHLNPSADLGPLRTAAAA